MKPGQVLTGWWQQYVAGRLKTPQDIYHAARNENPDAARSSDRFFGIPADVNWDAPKRLSAPSVFLSETYLRQGHKADWQSVDARLMRWAALFVEYARKRDVPLYIHCAYRGEAEQERVNAAGRSNAHYPCSAHNIGEAVDIVHSVFYWDMSPQEWRMLHVLGLRALDRVNSTLTNDQKLDLTWGGDFKRLYDPAHWEIADYRSRLRRLREADPVRYTPRAILARYRA